MNMGTGNGRRRRKRADSENLTKDDKESLIDFDRIENIIKNLQSSSNNNFGCQYGYGSFGLQLYLNERFLEKNILLGELKQSS